MTPEALTHLSFNTGRQYTAAGQHVDVALSTDDYVYFYDRSRLITGRFKAPGHPLDAGQVQGLVMHRYDLNEYEPIGLYEFEQAWKAATAPRA